MLILLSILYASACIGHQILCDKMNEIFLHLLLYGELVKNNINAVIQDNLQLIFFSKRRHEIRYLKRHLAKQNSIC